MHFEKGDIVAISNDAKLDQLKTKYAFDAFETSLKQIEKHFGDGNKKKEFVKKEEAQSIMKTFLPCLRGWVLSKYFFNENVRVWSSLFRTKSWFSLHAAFGNFKLIDGLYLFISFLTTKTNIWSKLSQIFEKNEQK